MSANHSVLHSEVPILAFHKVDPGFEWGVTRVTPRQFRSVLQVLKDRNYQTVSVHDALDPKINLPENPIVITFDDSYASVFEYAFPILQEFQYTATVFVITGFAGEWNRWDVNLGGLKFRHLSWEQISKMSEAGIEIGSHTVHHPDLTRVSYKILENEVSLSKAHLEDTLGKKIDLISFPFGRYNNDVVSVCQAAGYKHGCGFWMRKKSDQPFVFERKAYYLFDNHWSLQAKLDHHWGRVAENMKLRVINFCSHGTSFVKTPKFERYNK